MTDNEVAAGAHTMDVGAMCATGQSGGGSVDLFSGGTVIVLG